MSTHDVLAYAFATETVGAIRRGEDPWSALFSPTAYVTSSRAWPVPDFVISDTDKGITAAGEFKPPDQTKREYLTGLGQAVAYSEAFDYSLLVVPEIADDGYPIADHITRVLGQPALAAMPIGLLSYKPAVVSATNAPFTVSHFFSVRLVVPAARASLNNSFYAKWREVSPEEVGAYLEYLYEEARRPSISTGTIRDRAFDRLWKDIQAGKLHHWGGGVRTAKDTPGNREGVGKNYRNFLTHIGWIETDGRLTNAGLRAFHLAFRYSTDSMPFLDYLAFSVLLDGKHLVLLRAIYEFQNAYLKKHGNFESEDAWLQAIEDNLEERGFLKRNPGRAGAAVKGSARQFLKAEKQLWRELNFIVPSGASGGRSYHRDRGFVFDWSRITEVVRTSR